MQGFKLTAHSITTGNVQPDIQTEDRNLRIPEPEISAVLCSKARDQNICRIVLTAADEATHLMQQGGNYIISLSLFSVAVYEFRGKMDTNSRFIGYKIEMRLQSYYIVF